MNYRIRQAEIKDLDGIHKLIYNRCLWFLEKGVKGWNINYYPNKYNQKYFEKQMELNKLIVIEENNNLCGVMLLKEQDNDYWNDDKPAYYIRHLATDIKLKGIGKLLINYAMEQCKKDNKEYLRLDCYKSSKFLNEYYRIAGFKNIGTGTLEDYDYNLWEMKI